MTSHVRIGGFFVAMALLACGSSTSSTGTGNGTGSGSGTGTSTGTGTGTGASSISGVGAACTTKEDCATGLECLPGMQFPGNICSRKCVSDTDCGSNGVCVDSQQGNFCVRGCDPMNAGDCDREGYVCQPVGGADGICLGNCNDFPDKSCGLDFLQCSATLGICEGKVDPFGGCSISESDPDLRQCKSGSICMAFEGQGNTNVGYCFPVFGSESGCNQSCGATYSGGMCGPAMMPGAKACTGDNECSDGTVCMEVGNNAKKCAMPFCAVPCNPASPACPTDTTCQSIGGNNLCVK